MATGTVIHLGSVQNIHKKLARYILVLYSDALENFLSEVHNYFLWNIVCFALGIIFYFSLSLELNLYLLSWLVIAILICVAIARNSAVRLLILPLFFFLLGLDIAAWRTHMIPSHGLVEAIPSAKVYGVVKHLYPAAGNHAKLVVEVKRTYPGTNSKILMLQLTTRNLNPDVKVGDLISFYASLAPVSKQQFPYGYNFARHAHFNLISASAYSLSNMWIVKPFNGSSLLQKFERLRMTICHTLNDDLGKVNGGIAAALMVGEQKSISADVLNNMRVSGLSHVLSVSGLHLSLVTIICMFAIRYLLSHSLYLAQQYNIKKIAAFASIVISFGYLFISGMQVAALRAFIMSAAIMLSIILDRQDNAKRAVFIAGFLILLVNPESILHPSFQMSFSAVIALVASYEFYIKYFHASGTRDGSLFSKLKFYFLGTLFSSFIAGTATSIFVIYHFHTYSNYSVLANLLAAPILSLLIMPSLVLTFLLMPLGLQQIGLYILNIGISMMLQIAKYVSALPAAGIIFPPFSHHILLMFSCGLLWLSIWEKKWRLLGLVPIAWSFVIIFFIPFPDMIIDARYHAVIARTDAGEVMKIGGQSHVSKLHKAQWLVLSGGVKDITPCPMQSTQYSLRRKNYTAVITLASNNRGVKEFARLTTYTASGVRSFVIDRAELDACGTIFIYANKKGLVQRTECYVNATRHW